VIGAVLIALGFRLRGLQGRLQSLRPAQT
jgi:hypothetical protein